MPAARSARCRTTSPASPMPSGTPSSTSTCTASSRSAAPWCRACAARPVGRIINIGSRASQHASLQRRAGLYGGQACHRRAHAPARRRSRPLRHHGERRGTRPGAHQPASRRAMGPLRRSRAAGAAARRAAPLGTPEDIAMSSASSPPTSPPTSPVPSCRWMAASPKDHAACRPAAPACLPPPGLAARGGPRRTGRPGADQARDPADRAVLRRRQHGRARAHRRPASPGRSWSHPSRWRTAPARRRWWGGVRWRARRPTAAPPRLDTTLPVMPTLNRDCPSTSSVT